MKNYSIGLLERLLTGANYGLKLLGVIAGLQRDVLGTPRALDALEA